MTNQETFDIVVNHLRDQDGPAVNYTQELDGVCAYRAPDGRKCAAGVLIPDPDYHPSMEGSGLRGASDIVLILERDGHSLPLVVALQQAHDGATRTNASSVRGSWAQPIEPSLSAVAKCFGLTYEVQ